jgi:hypothetical protein
MENKCKWQKAIKTHTRKIKIKYVQKDLTDFSKTIQSFIFGKLNC